MATGDQKPDTFDREVNSQALALAEQLGRIAGTVQGTAESWLNRASITDQLIKVRDGATQLLNSLGGGARNEADTAPAPARPRPTRQPARAASADPAHAPGKKHRKAAAKGRSVRRSNSTIPKVKASAAVRRRRKS